MHCNDVADRIAAWADQQLAPAECELLEAHLERCPSCMKLAQSISAQELKPKHRPVPPPNWSRMDAELALEMSRQEKRSTTHWYHRPYRVTVTVGVAYAAALAMALSWGLHTQQQLEAAQNESIVLKQALDRERRLAAEPAPMVVPYRLANHKSQHAPSRGTF